MDAVAAMPTVDRVALLKAKPRGKPQAGLRGAAMDVVHAAKVVQTADVVDAVGGVDATEMVHAKAHHNASASKQKGAQPTTRGLKPL